jgi:hypothetical protein
MDRWYVSEEDDDTVSCFTSGIPAGPTEFPELVGMDLVRAKCLVEQWGYYTTSGDFVEYKRNLRKLLRKGETLDPRLKEKDPCRVIFWLDAQGYVATTPRVG